MSILIEKANYLVKMNIMLNMWHVWHPCTDLFNLINAIKINHLYMIESDFDVYLDDVAILKQNWLVFKLNLSRVLL
jgi:hypothetical protein